MRLIHRAQASRALSLGCVLLTSKAITCYLKTSQYLGMPVLLIWLETIPIVTILQGIALNPVIGIVITLS